MATLKELKTNFVGGEQDPLLIQRSDVKAYYTGAEYLRNVIVLPQGGVRSRPGTRYLWTVPEIPVEDGGGLSDVRMFEFQFSTDQTYLFVFHHKAVTVFRNQEVVATVVTPYNSWDLRAELTDEGDLISTGISVTQSRDTMFVFHQDYQTRQIKRDGSHTAWLISAVTFTNLPIFDFGDTVYVNGVDEVQTLEFPSINEGAYWFAGDTFRLIVEDEKTDNIKFDLDRETLRARIEEALLRLPNIGTGLTVSYAGGTQSIDTVFTVTFGGTNGKRPWGSMFFETTSSQQVPSLEIFVETPGERQGETVWSATRGWPRCGVFFGGRLWVAGTKYLPNTVWASRAGAPTDFNSEKFVADYGISATTDTDDVPAFIAIYAGRHLQFFSTAAEFYIPISETDAVTPENIVLRRTTSRGAKAGLRVFEVDGATHFVQRRGKALREFIFADVELAYQANNISLLASHLMRDPVGFALRRSSSTSDADYEFLPNSDGTMTVFCTLRTQDVNAMALWNTQGQYDDVAVVLDEVYFSIVREIDGDQVKMIEVMDSRISVDCAKYHEVVGAPVETTDLDWLPSTTVEVTGDGFAYPPRVSDAGGVVTFQRPIAEWYGVGLKYPEVLPDMAPGLIWGIKTLPFEVALPDGAAMGRKRRVVTVDVRVSQTQALQINGREMPFREFGVDALDTPVTPFTGVKRERGFLGWDFEGQITIGSDQSTQATILGLAYSVSIG